MQIRKILVPYDFSQHSEHALDWALELAEKWQARLELMHVIHPLPQTVAFSQDVYARAEQNQLATAQEDLEAIRAKKMEGATVLLDCQVCRGMPSQAICDEAKAQKADLIVMGSHGRTGLSHVLIGSVAEWVMRYAPCPVLVTKLSDPA